MLNTAECMYTHVRSMENKQDELEAATCEKEL